MSLLKSVAAWTGAGAAAWWGVRSLIRLSRHYDLTGRNVLVTGGARGLGLVLARQFVDRGARVALWSRNDAELTRAQEDLRERGTEAYLQRCDVQEPSQIQTSLARLEEDFGPIDVLVNNAGVIQVGPVESMTLADYETALATHFWGPLHTMRGVIPSMQRRGGGRIVNIASLGGLVSFPHLPAYCASKFALVGLSRGLRNQLIQSGIYVTTVCPGLMRTGSARRALFKSKHRAEYAWFSIGSALPGISMSAEQAARRIVAACVDGRPELQLSLPTRMAALGQAVCPELTAEILSQVDQLLPNYGGIEQAQVRGYQSESPWSESPLTALGRRAAWRNNEMGERDGVH